MDMEEFVFVDADDASEDDTDPPKSIAELWKWLDPTDYAAPSSEYGKHLSSHMNGTSQWVRKSDPYLRFLSPSTGCLWIKGIPGSGKSVVAATIISELAQEEGATVLYFFFRHIILSNRTPHSLVRDWLSQVIEKSKRLCRTLTALVSSHGDVQKVPFETLWKTLVAAVSSLPKVYLIADALDEMESLNDDFLGCLASLGQLRPSHIKVLITSRPIARLETVICDPTPLVLRLDHRHVDKDITIYTRTRLSLSRFSAEDEELVRQALQSKGSGLFLYARLMLDKILERSDRQTLRSDLEMLPVNIEAMYTSMLAEHATRSGIDQDLQMLILQWVTHATRPLRLIELGTMIATVPSSHQNSGIRERKNLVRRACGPLLEILLDETVQVIHHSFTEFLINPESEGRGIPPAISNLHFPVIDGTPTHQMMAVACLNYLLSGCFHNWTVKPRQRSYGSQEENKGLYMQYPLLHYSASNWFIHVVKSGVTFDGHHTLIDNFLMPGSHSFASWKALYWSAYKEPTIGSSPLHVAAELGLTCYLEHLLQQGYDVDAIDSAGRPAIACAASRGNDGAVRLLINHNALLDVDDLCGLKPLHFAAKSNHAHIVRLLLEAGVMPLTPKTRSDRGRNCGNSRKTIGYTALHYAAYGGYVETMTELINHVPHEELSAALNRTAARGFAGAVSLLAKIKGVLQTAENTVDTPLFLAARSGDCNTVEVLLQAGATATKLSQNRSNRRSYLAALQAGRSHGYTPLHGLAYSDSIRIATDHRPLIKIAAMLLDAGCDIDARDPKGNTPLSTAITQGRIPERARHVDLANFLLKRGADPFVLNNEGNCLLHVTQDAGIVDMLLKYGIGLDLIRLADGKTPLLASIDGYGNSGWKNLLDNGADCNHQDSEGNTALHLACSKCPGRESQIQSFLDAGAQPNLRNYKGQTCVYLLSRQSDIEFDATLLMLLKGGLDLNIRDYKGRSALLCAALTGSSNRMRSLILHGAKEDTKDHMGKGVLHHLSHVSSLSGTDADLGRQSGRKDSYLEELVEAGHDPRAVDNSGDTLLHAAVVGDARSECSRTFRLKIQKLTDMGVDPSAQNHKGQNVLHLMAMLDRDPYHSFKTEDRLNALLDPTSGVILDINATDNDGEIPLHYSVRKCSHNSKALLEHGSQHSCKSHAMRTPLHCAARSGQSSIVGHLCEIYTKHLTDIDQPDIEGITPLMDAACSGRPESISTLLDAGADPRKKDKKGRTALHHCALYEKSAITVQPQSRLASGTCGQLSEKHTCQIREVIRMLLARDTDVYVIDKAGMTAYLEALQRGNDEVICELWSYEKKRASLQDDYSKFASRKVFEMDSLKEQWLVSRARHELETLDTITLEQNENHQLCSALSLGNEAVVEKVLELIPDVYARQGATNQTILNTLSRWGFAAQLRKLDIDIDKCEKGAEPLLHSAAQREVDNRIMIETLLEFGVDVNARAPVYENNKLTDKLGPTVLHTLASSQDWWNAQAMDRLLMHGADPNIMDCYGCTALDHALRVSDAPWKEATVTTLLKHGARIDLLGSDGLSVLNRARDAKSVRMLLEKGANVKLGRRPALYDAIDRLDAETVRMLLDAGTDPNAPDSIRMANDSVIKLRRDDPVPYRATIRYVAPLEAVYSRTVMEDSAQEAAVEEITRLLLAYGADPWYVPDGKMPVLHCIVAEDRLIGPFLDRGIDLEKRDHLGRTILMLACEACLTHNWRQRKQNTTAVEQLIHAGADVRARSDEDMTAMHYLVGVKGACEDGRIRALEQLISKGADTNVKNNKGQTPLLSAIKEVNYPFVQKLLDAGSDPRVIDNERNSALHFLASRLGYQPSSAELLTRFVKLGVDIDAANQDGNTPLFVFISNSNGDPSQDDKIRHRDLITPFLDAGADVGRANNDGETLLHGAAKRTHCTARRPAVRTPRAEKPRLNEGEVDPVADTFAMLLEMGLDPRAEDKEQRSAIDVAAACGNENIVALFAQDT